MEGRNCDGMGKGKITGRVGSREGVRRNRKEEEGR